MSQPNFSIDDYTILYSYYWIESLIASPIISKWILLFSIHLLSFTWEEHPKRWDENEAGHLDWDEDHLWCYTLRPLPIRFSPWSPSNPYKDAFHKKWNLCTWWQIVGIEIDLLIVVDMGLVNEMETSQTTESDLILLIDRFSRYGLPGFYEC